jgi:hypothetical protein
MIRADAPNNLRALSRNDPNSKHGVSPMPTHPLASPPLSLVCERSIPDDTPNLNEVPGKRLHRYFHINNLARPHESLREPIPGLKGKYRDCTPAMALGITGHPWSVKEFIIHPVY